MIRIVATTCLLACMTSLTGCQTARHVAFGGKSNIKNNPQVQKLVDESVSKNDFIVKNASNPISIDTKTPLRTAERFDEYNQIIKTAGVAEDKPVLVPIPDGSNQKTAATSTEMFVSQPGVAISLPQALGMVSGQNPAVGFAQWKVQEAYAQLDKAQVLWLPSIQAGFSFNRHDGNYQASNGQIVDVNKNSFQYGLGAGGVGAGTSQRPGAVAQFHLADAIFQPEIAQKNAWGKSYKANAVKNKHLLSVAHAYFDLLDAEQKYRIVEESGQKMEGLVKLTQDYAATGQGLQSDADRMATEIVLIQSRLLKEKENSEVASAKLSELLSYNSSERIIPSDITVLPINLVSINTDLSSQISTGLANRPELKEAQNLVSMACDAYKRQKLAPFIPSVLLGFSTGGFGGGTGSQIDDVENRYDFDAMMTWEVRNLGLGEKSRRRETKARIQQSKYQKLRLLDKVSREISEANAKVIRSNERMQLTQRAILTAENSFKRNLSRIRDGQGLPIEVLQSLQALETAQNAYLASVIDYNKAQFQLQWALGWPVNAS